MQIQQDPTWPPVGEITSAHEFDSSLAAVSSSKLGTQSWFKLCVFIIFGNFIPIYFDEPMQCVVPLHFSPSLSNKYI